MESLELEYLIGLIIKHNVPLIRPVFNKGCPGTAGHVNYYPNQPKTTEYS